MKIPAELRYTEHDEWASIDGSEMVTGITDYAQDQLSDIVYIELPEIGDRYGKGEPYGVVESVKAASDVYAPVAGEIVAINQELESSPEIINQDPYGRGWFVRIKADDASEFAELMPAEAYRAHVEAKGQ